MDRCNIHHYPGYNCSIFEHQSFSVAEDETVRFVQPSEQSRVLNRVTGASVSSINGNILANGQVYLVNPSGIIFGTGAVVEAARLHAISGVLSNDDFIINDGERIAQLIIAKHERVNWVEVTVLDETARGAGGFGSTGM